MLWKELSHMEKNKPTLVILGQFQNGKSTLLNCLLGGEYAIQGEGLATTNCIVRYTMGDMPEIRAVSKNCRSTVIGTLSKDGFLQCLKGMPDGASVTITAYSPFLETLDVIDSPGWGAKDKDNSTAEEALKAGDVFVYVLTKALDNLDIAFFKQIVKQNKTLFVVLNCMNERKPNSSKAKEVTKEIWSKLVNAGFSRNCQALYEGEFVFPVNLRWAEFALQCASKETLNDINDEIKGFFRSNNPDRGRVLVESGLPALRRSIVTKTERLCRIPGIAPLGLLDRTWDLISNDLLSIYRR